jgi:hypothetical protein
MVGREERTLKPKNISPGVNCNSRGSSHSRKPNFQGSSSRHRKPAVNNNYKLYGAHFASSSLLVNALVFSGSPPPLSLSIAGPFIFHVFLHE